MSCIKNAVGWDFCSIDVNKRFKRYAANAVCIASVFLCSGSSMAALESVRIEPPDGLKIGNGESVPPKNALYALLLSDDGKKWRVSEVSEDSDRLLRSTSRERRGKEEILVFSADLSTVEPYFTPYVNWRTMIRAKRREKNLPKSGEYLCASGDSQERTPYNPCDSSFAMTINNGATAAANVLTGVLTLGTSVLLMGGMYYTAVDHDKVRAVLKDTDVYTKIFWLSQDQKLADIQQAEEDRLKAYRKRFSSARSSRDYGAFVEEIRLSSYDPDGLVGEAKRRFDETKKLEDLEENKRQEELKLQKENQRKEYEARQARLATWRKELRVGDETFCGPVVELRPPMLKIAIKIPLQGYPNETWLRVNEAYPEWMAGCRHVNGRVMPVM